MRILRPWVPLDISQIRVAQTGGRVQVDLPRSAATALAEQGFGPGTEIFTRINFTGYSHAEISQLTYTIEGDCRAFHVAIGGDTCAPFAYPDAGIGAQKDADR